MKKLSAFCLLVCSSAAFAHDWQPVTGQENLKALFANTVLVAELKPGTEARAIYNADGTGMLEAWGDRFPRLWAVQSDTEVCINIDLRDRCFTIEQDMDEPGTYKATRIDTGETVQFTVTDQDMRVSAGPATNAGGAAQPSAEEIAAKLANPNAPLATFTFRLQYRGFTGDLPNAENQGGTTLLAQPSFPFALANGDSILFRPALPLQMGFPTFNPNTDQFETKFGLGDLVFDLAYARTTDKGWLYAGGIVSSLPTATSGLGTDNWTLGPEALIGKMTKKNVLGTLVSHQWDVAGSGADTSLTTVQVFYTHLPGGGWNLGSTPIMVYDHESSQWTIPINFTVGKTVILSGRPWKISGEINFFVDQPDAFGPEWFIGFNVGPVVENVMAGWFK